MTATLRFIMLSGRGCRSGCGCDFAKGLLLWSGLPDAASAGTLAKPEAVSSLRGGLNCLLLGDEWWLGGCLRFRVTPVIVCSGLDLSSLP